MLGFSSIAETPLASLSGNYGVSLGVSSAAAVGQSTADASGSAVGLSTIGGVLSALAKTAGASVGSSGVSGAIVGSAMLVGASEGSSVASGSGAFEKYRGEVRDVRVRGFSRLIARKGAAGRW